MVGLCGVLLDSIGNLRLISDLARGMGGFQAFVRAGLILGWLDSGAGVWVLVDGLCRVGVDGLNRISISDFRFGPCGQSLRIQFGDSIGSGRHRVGLIPMDAGVIGLNSSWLRT